MLVHPPGALRLEPSLKMLQRSWAPCASWLLFWLWLGRVCMWAPQAAAAAQAWLQLHRWLVLHGGVPRGVLRGGPKGGLAPAGQALQACGPWLWRELVADGLREADLREAAGQSKAFLLPVACDAQHVSKFGGRSQLGQDTGAGACTDCQILLVNLEDRHSKA